MGRQKNCQDIYCLAIHFSRVPIYNLEAKIPGGGHYKTGDPEKGGEFVGVPWYCTSAFIPNNLRMVRALSLC